MAEWRLIAQDLESGALLGVPPMISWKSSDDLNDAGSFDATIPMYGLDEAVRNRLLIDATHPPTVTLLAERNGVPLFTGVPWRSKWNAESNTIDVAGRNLLSIWDHVPQRVTYAPVNVCQLTIFRELVTATPTPDINLITHGESCPVLRTRDYQGVAGKLRGESLRELSAVLNGFDFDFRSEYAAGQIERHLRLYYPRRGAVGSDLRFRDPGNAELLGVEDDGTQTAAWVQGTGGEADTPIEVIVPPGAGRGLGYYFNRRDVTELSTLTEIAEGELRDRTAPDRYVLDLRIDPADPMQPWGSWDLGDDCAVVIDNTPRFPAGVDGTPGLVVGRRIVSHVWEMNADGETLSLRLAHLGAVRGRQRDDTETRLRALEGTR